MKRLTFLAGLLGLPLLGQKRPAIDCTGGKCDPGINRNDAYALGWQAGKALNGQCPHCGTMAEPVKTYVGLDGEGQVEKLKAEVLLRCKRCNAAFWQDTEDR